MKKLKHGIVGGAALLLSFVTPQVLNAANPAEAETIGRIVRETDDLSSLQALLEKTKLGSDLSKNTESRFTLFAPTNEAFKKLPKGAVETLLAPQNNERLEEVFNFHVLPTSQPEFGLEQFTLLRTATGQFVSINYKNKVIGGAGFTAKPIPCSNGVIYLIDTVLTPTTDDLFQHLQKDGRFTIFTKAITASRQGKTFQNMHGLYTTFAPTDEAFKKLAPEFVDSLFLPENDERLADIIKHHITEGTFAAGKVPGVRSLGVSDVTPRSVFGQQLNFKATAGGATIDGAVIKETDLPCANGIVHVIDSVIPPVERDLFDILRKDDRFSILVNLLDSSGLSLNVASSQEFTVFAPTDDAWKASGKYADIIANPSGKNREVIFGLLARHVIVGKHVSENSKPYNKIRTIHGAPIYLLRDGDKRTINGVSIRETDIEGYNGLVNVIDGVIPDPMELPEKDISSVDAIEFAQDTLKKGSELYTANDYEASWRYYIRRGQEFIVKYSAIANQNDIGNLESAIFDSQPMIQFANKAWTPRNAFKDTLRNLERQEDRIQDNRLLQSPEKARFGR
jgi:transforming growth factor-beta-induced protein